MAVESRGPRPAHRRGIDLEVNLVLDTIGGLPLHPLIVHAVVVLVPLASLLLLLAALSPRIRHWAGILTPVVATITLLMVPLASQSGEALQRRVQETPALQEHVELGDSLVYFVLLVTILAWALWFLDRRVGASTATAATAGVGADVTRATAPRSGLLTAVIVLSVLSVVATTVQVVRIGHSGATATWSKVGATTPKGGEGGDD